MQNTSGGDIQNAATVLRVLDLLLSVCSASSPAGNTPSDKHLVTLQGSVQMKLFL